MWARGGWRERWKAALTLPEGQEDDRLDGEEFEHGFVGPEQVAGREEEEEERVESQADGEVVDDGDVEVASVDAAQREEKGMRNPRFQQSFCPCLCHVGGALTNRQTLLSTRQRPHLNTWHSGEVPRGTSCGDTNYRRARLAENVRVNNRKHHGSC